MKSLPFAVWLAGAWVAGSWAEDIPPVPPAVVSPPPAQIIPYAFDQQKAVDWANRHSAGMVVKQRLDGESYPTGSMHRGEASGGLGETPPVYVYNLQTKKLPILLGKRDDRHKFWRSIELIRQDGNKLLGFDIFIEIQWPRWQGPGGFVFMRGEKTISKIGIIVPPIKRDPEVSESDPNYTTEIRVEGKGPVVFGVPERVLKKPPEKLDERYVVLMHAPGADWRKEAIREAPPESAHILWIEFTEDGRLAADRAEEWFESEPLPSRRAIPPMLRLPGK